MRIVNKFTIDEAKQNLFAELSRDYNPIHIDEVYSRRSLFGERIVHGLHALLICLDHIALKQNSLFDLRKIKYTFPRPLKLFEVAEVFIHEEAGSNIFNMKIESGGKTICNLRAVVVQREEKDQSAFDQLEFDKEINVVQESDLLLCRGTIKLGDNNHKILRELFPHLANKLPDKTISYLLGTTRLIGTKCPGLNSIYYSGEVDFPDIIKWKENCLDYEVKKYDDRFKLISIESTSNNISGKFNAFYRPPKVTQPSFKQISAQIKSNSFSKQNALIIGGSRGLGELTAKILSAGGADVTITYNKGMDDAREVASQINSNGGKCSLLFWNHKVAENQFSSSFTHLYYFATPHISANEKGRFSKSQYKRYSEVYLFAFYQLANSLKEKGLKKIFYPSSIFVSKENPYPLEFIDYVVAKSAAETLCSIIEQQGVVVFTPRLPKLKTDQTNSIVNQASEEPLTVLLKQLQLFEKM